MTQKACLVTGGGRGISAAIAREMHGRGYKLALMSPSESCEKLAVNPVAGDWTTTLKPNRSPSWSATSLGAGI